ncbi:hypothetical protein BaRGS_00018260, partial [Batillaria attramentaria]
NNAVYIVLLVILSVGLLGNLLSLFIWTAITTSKSPCKKNLHGRSRLFSILCISDTCAVVSFMVAFSYKVQNDATGWCHFHIYLTVGVVFALFSEMVIIAIGIQRLASLLCPFHAKAKCSLVRQWAALVGLFLLNLLFRVPFAIWRVEVYHECVHERRLLFQDHQQMHDFARKTVLFNLVVAVLTLCILVYVHSLLLRLLWVALHQVYNTTSSERQAAGTRRVKLRITQLIIALTIPSIIRCFLAQIANAILMANELTVPVELVYCVDSVFVLTVTVNVIFYPNFSAKFRDKMVELWDALIEGLDSLGLEPEHETLAVTAAPRDDRRRKRSQRDQPQNSVQHNPQPQPQGSRPKTPRSRKKSSTRKPPKPAPD